MKENKGKCCEKCNTMANGHNQSPECFNPQCVCHTNTGFCPKCEIIDFEKNIYMCINSSCSCHQNKCCKKCLGELELTCMCGKHEHPHTVLMCKNASCECHTALCSTPQATSTEESASQSASPELWKHELWVKINEFHLATLITADTHVGSHKHEENKIVLLHQIIQTIEQEKQRAVEEYKERLVAIVERDVDTTSRNEAYINGFIDAREQTVAIIREEK